MRQTTERRGGTQTKAGLALACAMAVTACGEGRDEGGGDVPLADSVADADGGAGGFGRDDFEDWLENLYDEDGTEGYDDYPGGGSDAPPPFSRKFEGLVENRARWANFEVDLVAARVERGKDETWDEGALDGPAPDDVYVEIDVGIANTRKLEDGLSRRSTWDLILADGTRLRQSSALHVLLALGDRTVVTLRHLASEGVDLAGSVLELNGPRRGVLHPERVPLDAPYAADFDLRLVQLEGEVMESSDPERFDRRRIEVLEARVSRNSRGMGWRADRGEVYVDLDLRITGLDEFLLWDSDFGLVADGSLERPISDPNEDLSEGTTRQITVTFGIPDDTREFDLRFLLGDAHEPDVPEWAERHVDLGDAEASRMHAKAL